MTCSGAWPPRHEAWVCQRRKFIIAGKGAPFQGGKGGSSGSVCGAWCKSGGGEQQHRVGEGAVGGPAEKHALTNYIFTVLPIHEVGSA